MFFRYLIVLSLFTFPLTILCQQNDLFNLRKELENKSGTNSKQSDLEILNVSYDPTREFYDMYNSLFTKWWKERTGQNVFVVQSHGGSGKQARAVISGLKADVVSLALAFDIDAIQKLSGSIGTNWQKRLPNNSSPYYSTIVFLVRKGNPKQIKDWGDLVKQGITIVTPNPKTSGVARWTYLAAWAWALKTFKDDPKKAKEYMIKLYKNAPVLDTGARAATTAFVRRKSGDVLLTWENEAYLTMEKINGGEYEIVFPSISILAEPPVAWVNTIIEKKGTEDVAQFYLKYLYSLPAQELIAKYYFRPFDAEVAKKYEKQYPSITLVPIEDFGGWEEVQKLHFQDNAQFDEIYQSEKK